MILRSTTGSFRGKCARTRSHFLPVVYFFADFFFVRCAQSTEKILFNSHSFFTSFLHASLPPVSPGTSSRPNRTPAFFIPFSLPPPSPRPVTSAFSEKLYELFIRKDLWNQHPRISLNILDFPRVPGAFLSLAHPFYATCSARERRLGFHGCLR